MKQAWRPRWRRARRYLSQISLCRVDNTEDKKHTVDERVKDGHGTSRDTSVGVDLLED
jgi:hypothetical protein